MVCVVEEFKLFPSYLGKWCDPHHQPCDKSNFASKVYPPCFLPSPHLLVKRNKNSFNQIERLIWTPNFAARDMNWKVTSSWIWWLTPQTNKVLPPWIVAKNIIAVPSQIWYLTDASNWMPSNRNKDSPLKIGRSSKARQASASNPKRVATLRYLSCHLQKSWSINNGKDKSCVPLSHHLFIQSQITHVSNFRDLTGINFLKSFEMRA